MEPLTAGAIAIGTAIVNKALEKTGEKVGEALWDKTAQFLVALKKHSSDTVIAIEKAPSQPLDYGKAVLEVESAAKANPELNQAVQELVAAAKADPKVASKIQQLETNINSQAATEINNTKLAEEIKNIFQGNTVIGGDFWIQQRTEQLIIKSNTDINDIINQRLNERGYVIRDVLGIGGFGITYLTEDKTNKENLFVIKSIKNELIKYICLNPKQLKNINKSIDSFRNEAKILLNYKHSNIVQIHSILSELFELQIGNYLNKKHEVSTYKLELLFLIMEYIEGENLEELISRRGSPLPETEALRYIQQIGEALIVIHNKGLLHRDIKPQNIMVRKATNDAVLIDFGIARDFLPEITESMTVSFTPRYTPLEQRRRKGKRGNYTDIYGLAATLYYLLTEQPPTDAYERQLGDSLIELQEINPNISDTVNRAILWGMELEPSKRPQTVQEWLVKLLAA